MSTVVHGESQAVPSGALTNVVHWETLSASAHSPNRAQRLTG
jgi:hypothetical protein